MRRPIILDGNPFIHEYYRKNTKTLFDETGGNTGNLAFRYALFNHVVNPALLSWNTPVEQIQKAGDIILLPLANQLGQHTDLGGQAQKLAAIGLPVAGIGLGAQVASYEKDIVLSDGTMSWLKEIIALAPSAAPNIGARGEYSVGQIAKLGLPSAASVIGCPSNFINTHDDIAGMVASGFERKIRHVAVAAGIPFIKQLEGIEIDLAEIVTETNGAYITQHGLQMVQLSRGESAALDTDVFKLCKSYIRPAATDEEFVDWLRRYAYAFFDVRAWMDFLRRFDFVIGTRFHGIMLAIQAGVPAGCIAHDSRTLELCETMGVPVCYYKDINGPLTLQNMLDYFRFDAENYRETRQKLWQNYVSIFKVAELQPSAQLLRLAL